LQQNCSIWNKNTAMLRIGTQRVHATIAALFPKLVFILILRHSFEPRDNARLAHLCGSLDAHLRHIEDALAVSVSRRNEFFRVEGAKPHAEHAMSLLQALYVQAQSPISDEQLQLALVQAGAATAVDDAASSELRLRTRHASVQGRTPNQINYLRNILAHDVTFGIGPAGTGKTFLAVACAVEALERSAVQRIVLTRPAVEAGERLGFLPGDVAQKVDPYLRPLYDALNDLMGAERVMKCLEKGTLEVAPLAFMRGRTLNHAFVILDEAQNTTVEQMKMFLTRLGFGTKAVVAGDVSQIDLPRDTLSGLIDAERVLRRVRGVATTRFTASDVLRHPLVARIVEAYDTARLNQG
jgi:phosphate starvation-inducible protein PhoH and related proteins